MKCGSSRVGGWEEKGGKKVCRLWIRGQPTPLPAHTSMSQKSASYFHRCSCYIVTKVWKGEKIQRARTKDLTFSDITTITNSGWVSVWLLISASSEHCRGVEDTCVLSDNWSEGRGDTAWPTRRQRRWQRQRHGYIILSTVFMTLTMSTKTTELGAYK